MALPAVSLTDPFPGISHQQFQSGVIPYVNVGDLIALKRVSHCFYQNVSQDPNAKKPLDYPDNVYSWAPKQMVYLNIRLHVPSDFEMRLKCPHSHSRFSLDSLLKLAQWLRSYGKETKIPPCGLDYYHPREVSPLDYLDAIFDVEQRDPDRPQPTKIFHHLYKALGAPQVTNPLDYGKKAFFGRDGHSSTEEQKAKAIELYVTDCFVKAPLKDLLVEEEI